MAVVTTGLVLGGLLKAVKAGAITTGLFKVGKGLLSVGKGLKGVGKGLSKGMKSSSKSTTIAQGAKPKISEPRQQDTSQTISPSYYEDPKRQSIFKRTASDGSIESVKITVTNIKSVLFKQQKQLAKQSKNNANLEERLSDSAKKKEAGQKLNKQLSKAFSPLLGVISSVNSAIPLLMASIIGNMGFELAKREPLTEEEKKEKLTKKLIGDKEKPKSQGLGRLLGGAVDFILQDATDFDNRGVSGGKSAVDIINSDSTSTNNTSKTSKGKFFGKKTNDERLKNLNDTSLIDNNEVTNTIIINRPIEVPAK
jgi:hypothetical protein